MRMSARVLGQAFGLDAQEINALLKNEGFLEGEPGAYAVTEKGEKYAEEQDHHRGTGGYSWYNRDWTTRTWDEAVTTELDVTDEKKQQVRQQVAEARRAAPAPVAEEEPGPEPDDSPDSGGLDARPLLVAAGVIAVGFGIYKALPHLRRFMNAKVAPRFKHKKPAELPPVTPPENGEDRPEPSA